MDYLKVDQLVKGHVYRMFSRNLRHGVYDGNGGFIGIRVKFGEAYLFTELHWDVSEHFGTVKPWEDLGELVPPELACERTDNGTYDHETKRPVKWIKRPDPETIGDWVFVDSGTDEGQSIRPVSAPENKILFDKLDAFDLTEH